LAGDFRDNRLGYLRGDGSEFALIRIYCSHIKSILGDHARQPPGRRKKQMVWNDVRLRQNAAQSQTRKNVNIVRLPDYMESLSVANRFEG
jgi:hypothetical protein